MLRRIQKAHEPVTLGKPIVVELSKDAPLRGVLLRLAGSITIASGTTSGTPFTGNPSQLITNITVRRGGKDAIFGMSGEKLYALNKAIYKTLDQSAGLASGDAQSNTAVNVTLFVPFEYFKGVKPYDTLLNPIGLSSLTLIVDIAAAASVVVDGGDRTISVGTTTFTLNVTEYSEDDPEAATTVFADLRHSLVASKTVTASNANFQINDLPIGNRYVGFLVVAKDANVAGDFSNAIINRLRLKAGSNVFIDMDAKALREDNKRELGIEALIDGHYFIDVASDGRIGQALDVSPATKRQSLSMELDVTVGGSTTTIDVIGMEVILPVVQASK